jgi:hypothetical protein
MRDRRRQPSRRHYAALAVWALFGVPAPVTGADAAPVTLQVVATQGFAVFHHSALSRFVAAQMTRAGLADWRFIPAAGNGPAANRVDWTLKWNPYAGGAVRGFVHTLSHEEWFGRRPVTIVARLYLNGEYQTLVEAQAVVHGGSDDPDLAAAVVSATRNLLGPSGAYRAIDLEQYQAGGTRQP